VLKQLGIVLALGTFYDPKLNPNVCVAIVLFARHLVHAQSSQKFIRK